MEMRFLGICGSLRRDSLNLKLLKVAADLVPAGASFAMASIDGIPLYSQDLQEQAWPGAVRALCAAIAEADAVVIATPEYNYSVPGVLKNAIDWASRWPEAPFDGKPVAIMGASPGRLGTARAQYHLRQSFVFLNSRVLNRPEVMVGGAMALFGGEGRLTDEPTRKLIKSQMGALFALVMERRQACGQP